jgi:hypothetical protein
MELSALNSLAETGVGLNLAFSLVKSIRTRFVDRFGMALEIGVKAILADLSDTRYAKNGPLSPGVVKTDDIVQAFQRRTQKLEVFFVSVAFLVAAGLVYFLLRSSIDPAIDPGIGWAWAMFCLVWAPIVMTMVGQWVLYRYAAHCLKKRRKEYKISVELMVDIAPPQP